MVQQIGGGGFSTSVSSAPFTFSKAYGVKPPNALRFTGLLLKRQQ